MLPLLLAAPLMVHGHRGCRAVLPENTLPAFHEAVRVGADVLELDLHVTKDDQLVVTHDPELPDGRLVRALTLAEVKKVDVGGKPNPRFPKQKPVPGASIPTLDEVFAATKKAGRQYNIETKLVPGRPEQSAPPAEFAKLLVEAIRRHGLVDRAIVQSFDQRTLLEARKLEPKLRASLLTSDNHIDYVAAARSAGAAILSPNALWITKEDVAALHEAGIQVAPWTINDEEGWERAAAAGVDAIITDDPGALIAWLKERGLR